MKTRVTIYGENNEPMSSLGNDPEGIVKDLWEMMLKTIMVLGEPDSTTVVEIEKAEVWE